jgi:hypothetical protein
MSDHLLFHPSPASHYYSTQHAYSVKHSDSCAWLVQMSYKCGFALPRIVLPRFRNIDLIPFVTLELRCHLGSTKLRLMTHRRRTLSLSVTWILTMLRCYYCQDHQIRPVHGTSQPHFYPTGSLRYRITRNYPCAVRSR